ncbi:MAG: anti-sigma factor antagonist [Cytophagales bacterium]|nr:MAG: anti-sigma factor antagonist [Cytophagales bacterium]TAF59778.1 MAG: anti-sigma factor antagonist [Cytophagales bacterium]
MRYNIEKHEKYTLLSLNEDRVDSLISPQLKSEFVTLFQSGTNNLILDLKEVKYVDSSGLSAILVANRLTENNDGILVLTSVSDFVLKLLTISRLNDVLNVMLSVPEAVDAVFMHELEKDIRDGDND